MRSDSDGQNENSSRILRPRLGLLRRVEEDRERRYQKARVRTQEWLRQNPDAAKAFKDADGRAAIRMNTLATLGSESKPEAKRKD